MLTTMLIMSLILILFQATLSHATTAYPSIPGTTPVHVSSDDQIEPEFNGRWSSLNQSQQARIKSYISNQTEVGFTIMKQLLLSEAKKEKNMVYSPLSIHMVLSLVAAGSNGPTQDQLLTFLKSKSTQELNNVASTLMSLFFAEGSPIGGPSLSFINGVWVDKAFPVKPSFKWIVDTAYKAALKQVDFKHMAEEAGTVVNSWAEKETNGRIKDILAPGSVDSLTRLILANALFFKGVWKDRFDAPGTKEYDFHLLNGDSVKTSFMTRWMKSEKRYVSVFHSFKVLKLPYEQGKDQESISPCMCFFQMKEMDCVSNVYEYYRRVFLF